LIRTPGEQRGAVDVVADWIKREAEQLLAAMEAL